MKGIWIAAQSECRITNCNFVGCTVNGRNLCSGDSPVIIGDATNMNVAFPAGWSDARCEQWRKLHGLWRAPAA